MLDGTAAFSSSCSCGGRADPPLGKSRTVLYASGSAFASAISAAWIAAAPLASVTPCLRISSVDACGVHASISTAAEPVSSGVNTPMMMPPTCVNGNATSAMSSSTTCVFSA